MGADRAAALFEGVGKHLHQTGAHQTVEEKLEALALETVALCRLAVELARGQPVPLPQEVEGRGQHLDLDVHRFPETGDQAIIGRTLIGAPVLLPSDIRLQLRLEE